MPGLANSGVSIIVDLSEVLAEFTSQLFTVTGIIRITLEPGEQIRNFVTPDSGFVYVLRGKGSFTFEGVHYEAEEGKVMHGGGGMRLDYGAHPQAGLEYYLILYRPIPSETGKARLMHSHYELNPGMTPRISELLDAFFRNNLNVGSWSAFCDKMMFFQLIHETAHACRGRSGELDLKSRIEEAVGYMHDRYMDPIVIPDLAARCGMSVNYFSIRFRKQTGMSPMEYLIRIRLRRSMELLSESGCTIKEAAGLVGYADVYYFSRLFKKHIGYPPSTMRRLRVEGTNPER